MRKKPVPPESQVSRDGWVRMYLQSQYESWSHKNLWHRLRYWPDGERRIFGVLTFAK